MNAIALIPIAYAILAGTVAARIIWNAVKPAPDHRRRGPRADRPVERAHDAASLWDVRRP